LSERGFRVEEVEVTGELQEMVERGYIKWCEEAGVPAERLRQKAFLDTSVMGCART